MRILLVEDDYLEDLLVRQVLIERFKIADEDIITTSTESEFRERLAGIARSARQPELAIIDVMIRWTDPKPGAIEVSAVPEQVRREGPYRAGLRCAELLDLLNPDIPILFYTILEREDLESELFRRRGPDGSVDHRSGAVLDYARKEEDEGPLVEKLLRFLRVEPD